MKHSLLKTAALAAVLALCVTAAICRAGHEIKKNGTTACDASVTGNDESSEEGDDDLEKPPDQQALILKSSVGYQSNVFELDAHDRPVTGDWFQVSQLTASTPLGGKGSAWTASFMATSMLYYNESKIDEYHLRPDISWKVPVSGDTQLTLDARVSVLRERIFNEFHRVAERSEPGWSPGLGWNLETEVTPETKFNLKGGAEYIWYFHAPQDKLITNTKADLETEWSKGLASHFGMNWDLQDYRVRPLDPESSLNPDRLLMLEGRAVASVDLKLGGSWSLELEFNGGPNIDLTNGYYDAWVAGIRAELHWKREKWSCSLGMEPEWVRSSQRRANLNEPGNLLNVQEYVVETKIHYAWSHQFSVFGAAQLHVQRTNADQTRPDAALNNFTDSSLQVGIAYSF